ncbi:hypothetical protein [Sulfuricurvum sp.]|uniref:hypothetical protein n=1 Tax=Sulfuricurvum sp. TaxID=2025608 RepID=UPI003BB59AF5
MINTLREAQKQFQEIHTLLNPNIPKESNYFTQLSIATEEAYVIMNEGMCVSTTVCHKCAEHRDFIRSMLDILSELEINASAANTYIENFAQYSERVNKILQDIQTVLAT